MMDLRDLKDLILSQGGIVYMCMTTAAFPRAAAFQFLRDIQSRPTPKPRKSMSLTYEPASEPLHKLLTPGLSSTV